jgi:hypothetical protein
MATTYIQIASTILGNSTTSTVTFSNIPQTYTDLLIVAQTRTTSNGDNGNLQLTLGGSSRRGRWARYNNATITGASTAGFAGSLITNVPSSGIFATSTFYLPNYTNSTTSKIVSTNNTALATTALLTFMNFIAGLSLQTSATTSLTFEDTNLNNFAAGSLFQIYGITRGTI